MEKLEMEDIAIEPTEAEVEDSVERLKEILGIKNDSKDDLVMIYPPVEFSDEEITAMCNTDEWMKGFRLGAELGGLYTTLINNGMDVITAGSIVANEHAMRVNVETQKIINEGLKVQVASLKKREL